MILPTVLTAPGQSTRARREPDQVLPGPGRLSAGDRWSRKHAHTQRRLCERFAAPVIGTVTCQDIKTGHMKQIVNAGRAAGGVEGKLVGTFPGVPVSGGTDGTPGGQEILPTQERLSPGHKCPWRFAEMDL